MKNKDLISKNMMPKNRENVATAGQIEAAMARQSGQSLPDVPAVGTDENSSKRQTADRDARKRQHAQHKGGKEHKTRNKPRGDVERVDNEKKSDRNEATKPVDSNEEV